MRSYPRQSTYNLSGTALQLLKADFSPEEHNLFQALLEDEAYTTEVEMMVPRIFCTLAYTDQGMLMAGDNRQSQIVKFFVCDRASIDKLCVKLDQQVSPETSGMLKSLLHQIPTRSYHPREE